MRKSASSTALMDYLLTNYNLGEPIFVKDVPLGTSPDSTRQMLYTLCKEGLLRRCATGVFALPWFTSDMTECKIDPKTIIHAQYISRRGKVFGYYSGASAAYLLNLSNVLPDVQYIATNIGTRKKEVTLGGTRAVVSIARAEVTAENYRILQLLDVIHEIRKLPHLNLSEAVPTLQDYIQKQGLSRQELLHYIGFYPDATYRNLLQLGLYASFVN